MICILISDLNFYGKELKPNNERDCRVIRQPLSLLPEGVKEYIYNTKNDLTKKERTLAYSTLFCGLKSLFGISNCEIERTKEGKPYLVKLSGDENNVFFDEKKKLSGEGCKFYNLHQKNEEILPQSITHQKNQDYIEKESKSVNPESISISISHSDGVCAVCISDEGIVGIDIQAEIDALREKRLKARFFDDVNMKITSLPCYCYYVSVDENEACIYPFDEGKLDVNDILDSNGGQNTAIITIGDASADSFTARWAYCESVMKMLGGGFGDINRIQSGSDSGLSCVMDYTRVVKAEAHFEYTIERINNRNKTNFPEDSNTGYSSKDCNRNPDESTQGSDNNRLYYSKKNEEVEDEIEKNVFYSRSESGSIAALKNDKITEADFLSSKAFESEKINYKDKSLTENIPLVKKYVIALTKQI